MQSSQSAYCTIKNGRQVKGFALGLVLFTAHFCCKNTIDRESIAFATFGKNYSKNSMKNVESNSLNSRS